MNLFWFLDPPLANVPRETKPQRIAKVTYVCHCREHIDGCPHVVDVYVPHALAKSLSDDIASDSRVSTVITEYDLTGLFV